jgi:hypothetical protein
VGCLPRDKIMKRAADNAHIAGASPAQSQRFTDCVAEEVATLFRARPYLYLVQGLHNQAMNVCNK